MKRFIVRIFVLFTAISFLSSCVKTTRPVEPYQLGDENKNCQQIEGENANIGNRILENIEASNAQLTLNIVVGGVCLFLFWPACFFFDFTPYKKERNSLEARKQRLNDFYLNKQCSSDNTKNNTKINQNNTIETTEFDDVDECVVMLMKDRPKEVYEDVKRLCIKKLKK